LLSEVSIVVIFQQKAFRLFVQSLCSFFFCMQRVFVTNRRKKKMSFIKWMTVFVDSSVDAATEQLIRKAVPSVATIVTMPTNHASWVNYWESTKVEAALDRVRERVRPLNRFSCFVTSKHLNCPDVTYALYAMKIPTLSLFDAAAAVAAPSPSPFFADKTTLQVVGGSDAVKAFFTFPEALGRVFVIEGGDGSGKQTQAEMLIARLRLEGYKAETLDFPNDGVPTGEAIREILSGQCGDFQDIAPTSFAQLYSVNRFERRSEMLYWVQRGVNVILDRYMTANFGYQVLHVEESMRKSVISHMQTFEVNYLGLPKPHRVAYLQLSPLKAMQALLEDCTRRELDCYEQMSVDKKTAVMNSFKWCCEHLEGWTCVPCVDGDENKGPRFSRETIHLTLYELWRDEFVKA
jgi:dTMP kinase